MDIEVPIASKRTGGRPIRESPRLVPKSAVHWGKAAMDRAASAHGSIWWQGIMSFHRKWIAMNVARMLKGVVVALATVGLCLPEPLLAAAQSRGPVATDVALREGSVLVGQVVSAEGTGLEDISVSLRTQGKTVLTTRTGKGGYFAVKGLHGGVYQLVAQDGHGVYRLWSAGTAPPAAQEGAVLVVGNDVLRGQDPGPWKAFLTNPLIIAAVVATAVAVPVALHNAHQHAPASP